MYNDLKWETLAERRRKHKLILLYKMKHNLTPEYLNNLIPEHTNTTYNLRNADNIPNVNSRTQLYQTSFLPSVIRDWNNLPTTCRNSPTLNAFKCAMSKNIQKPSPLFNIGTRQGQILQTRLRLSCSCLRYDLYRRSLVESPLCACGQPETTDHFLLYCPNYYNLRQSIFHDIPCPLTSHNLLHGNEHLTFEENRDLITRTQRNIIATKRF